MRRIELSDRVLHVPVRVSKRCRRPKLVVGERHDVEIVVPPRTSQLAVDALLRDHRGWLERQLAKPPAPFALGLQRDDVVWIGGRPQPLPLVDDVEAWYRERARDHVTRAVHEE